MVSVMSRGKPNQRLAVRRDSASVVYRRAWLIAPDAKRWAGQSDDPTESACGASRRTDGRPAGGYASDLPDAYSLYRLAEGGDSPQAREALRFAIDHHRLAVPQPGCRPPDAE